MRLTKDTIGAALEKTNAPSSDFDLNPDGQGVAPTKDAAVLIPIVPAQDGLHIVLTKRSARLKAHPGQISFPGGRRDDGDTDLIETALREAEEETGLPSSTATVLGSLPTHDTVTSYRVTPVVAWIETPWQVLPNPGEVDEVFMVPLDHLLDVSNYHIQSRIWRGAPRFYYTVPYGPYYIWGATARILRGFADRGF